MAARPGDVRVREGRKGEVFGVFSVLEIVSINPKENGESEMLCFRWMRERADAQLRLRWRHAPDVRVRAKGENFGPL